MVAHISGSKKGVLSFNASFHDMFKQLFSYASPFSKARFHILQDDCRQLPLISTCRLGEDDGHPSEASFPIYIDPKAIANIDVSHLFSRLYFLIATTC